MDPGRAAPKCSRRNGSLSLGVSRPSSDRSASDIYIVGRAGHEARIVRIETNSSMAPPPPPRTCHLVAGVIMEAANTAEIHAIASWQVVSFNEQRGHQMRSGSYEYLLARAGRSFRIARKKIVLLEHVIDGYFDVYSI